ncbi:glycoside hydrolase [Gongronella butleri]|nr:glycoside hydrolase [Gongronella butleri]
MNNAKLSSAERAKRVKDAFTFAWSNYEEKAFGADEIRPVTGQRSDSRNGWGATIFDALDTLLIMGMTQQYEKALDHVSKVNWRKSADSSKTFETNIRYLGGLLSAHDLQSNPSPVLLKQAQALADQVIMPSFNTANHLPAEYVNVHTGKPVTGTKNYLAEFGTLQLELVRLSQLTGNKTYGQLGLNIIDRIANAPAEYPGLYAMTWDMDTFEPADQETQLSLWNDAVDSMHKFLRSTTSKGNVFLADIDEQGGKQYKVLSTGELICFLPANLLLGARYLNRPSLEPFAKELMDGCVAAWRDMPSGLAPESWSWIDAQQNPSQFPEHMQVSMTEFGVVPDDTSYDLRPETIESLFYFYRITGDPAYQDLAWDMFVKLEYYCKTHYGFTRIGNVVTKNKADVKPLNFQESYLFAETFKYLYLIFSDPNTISLNDWVFNTEAHPFKMAKSNTIQYRF